LAPVIETAAEWKPESIATVEVSERQRRPMTYTLAVVDEGLLDLTSFKTPNLHEEFYKREALGVTTWDLFDEVAGAYGAELERLLALGGSEIGRAACRERVQMYVGSGPCSTKLLQVDATYSPDTRACNTR